MGQTVQCFLEDIPVILDIFIRLMFDQFFILVLMSYWILKGAVFYWCMGRNTIAEIMLVSDWLQGGCDRKQLPTVPSVKTCVLKSVNQSLDHLT